MITAKEARVISQKSFEENIKSKLEQISQDIEWQAQFGDSSYILELNFKSHEFVKRIKKELKKYGYNVPYFESKYIRISW